MPPKRLADKSPGELEDSFRKQRESFDADMKEFRDIADRIAQGFGAGGYSYNLDQFCKKVSGSNSAEAVQILQDVLDVELSNGDMPVSGLILGTAMTQANIFSKFPNSALIDDVTDNLDTILRRGVVGEPHGAVSDRVAECISELDNVRAQLQLEL